MRVARARQRLAEQGWTLTFAPRAGGDGYVWDAWARHAGLDGTQVSVRLASASRFWAWSVRQFEEALSALPDVAEQEHGRQVGHA